ncbi:MAG TPA: ATP-binding protein [Actinomycetota bacterium]|nr:ATP-binding protein [Actinomycetota bacterium]
MTSILRLLPSGRALPDAVWITRHRGILAVLWIHVAGIPIFGLLRGFSLSHMVLETSAVAIPTAFASLSKPDRSLRMVAATLGLLISSGVLVHLSGGLIELHFHFFVMVAVVTLYQSWLPFLLAIGFVVLHHGTVGVLDPAGVYNHPSAIAHPWRWAAIHGLFILGESVACLAAWRLNENESARADEFDRKLAALVRSSDDAIVALTPEGLISSWNPAAASLFGMHPDSALGMPFSSFLGDPKANEPTLSFSAVAIDDHVQHREMSIVRPGGEHVQISLTISPIREPDGSISGNSVVARDITVQQIAQHEKEVSLSLLEATLESTADGIFVAGMDGRVVKFNKKLLQMWSVPDEVAAQGDSASMAFVVEQLIDPDAFMAKINELYADPEATSNDRLEFKDGRIFDRYSQPQRIDGVTVGRVWSFRDVTEQERAAENLRVAFEREREAAMSLRAVDDMKNSFLEAVSHELRTPLTAVLGNSLTLEHKGPEMSQEQQKSMLNSLSRNARKLERLLSDLLDLDRLARGILEPKLVPTDIRELVRSTLEDFQATGHEVGVDVEDLIAVVDAAKVERVLENLVANAVKYTPTGSHISVSIKAVGDGLLLKVDDDGPGVPDELKERIFDAFDRGSGSHSHSPGTGIGLSLVAKFAELHHGRAWVEDRPGGGASFKVSLRCKIVKDVALPQQHSAQT